MAWFDFIVALVGGGTVGVVVIVLLSKRLLQLQLDKALEQYKTKLDHKSSVLKTELSIYAHEQNVGLSRLDAQRSKAIESIYTLITNWHEQFITITAPNDYFENSPELELSRFYDLAVKFAGLSEKLTLAIRNRAIYFDQTSYESVAKYGSALTNLGIQFYAETFEKLDMTVEPDYELIAQ